MMVREREKLTVVEGVRITFPFATADRRGWIVEIDWSVVEKLDGRRGLDADQAEDVVLRHLHNIEFAALRAITRGDFDGALVQLSAVDVRI